ncbi:hypothetical protein [Actinomyces wuliandei]|uniref:hypothetical protein n=1 Tax=Actinomyces wuliandei TaxID=2057743 RepID=UPI000FD91C64|nr:hypothetical protein [Actinomyces wuliandei]
MSNDEHRGSRQRRRLHPQERREEIVAQASRLFADGSLEHLSVSQDTAVRMAVRSLRALVDAAQEAGRLTRLTRRSRDR